MARFHKRTCAAVTLLATTVGTLAQPAPPVSPAPVVDYQYDAKGNPTKTIQAPNVSGFNLTTSSSYDSLDRRKDSTDARSKTTFFGYNGREDLNSVTDPRSLVTQYQRNGLGDVTSLVSPDTGTDVRTFDAAGNLATRTDSRGVLATYSYDALNRLTGLVYTKSGSASLSYGWIYDQTGSGFANGVGRLTTSTHPDGSSTYTYDPQGRLITHTQVVNAKAGANLVARTYVVTYGYDAAGNITSIIYPSGRKLVVGYSSGLPSSLSLLRSSGANNPVTLLSNIQFDPFGGPSSWQWQLASGTQTHQFIRDNFGRLTRYRLGPNLRDLTYDAADRVSTYTHYSVATGAAVPSLDQSFGYDELGRLTSITTASSNWSIGYDDNGNRISTTLSGAASVYTVSSTSNRLVSTTNPARSFGYDSAGNTTSDTYTATYSLANRLATLTKGGVSTTYAVDGQGQRVRKHSSTGSSSTVMYVYDQAGHLLGEYDSTSKEIREYVWLGDLPVAVFTPNPAGALQPPLVYYIHSDHLGTPRVVLDTSNNIRWRWMAEPFGTNLAEENPASLGSFVMSLRLPGQLFDPESGLHYNYHRDYDASIGRYTQSDPIGLQGGINTYSYVGGNPVSFIDPNGLQADDRPTTPGVGLPNPAAAADRNIARQLQRILDDICRPDCSALEAEIKLIAAEIRERYFAMLGDPRDLFNKATIVRISRRGGSWVGHRQQFRDKQITLRKKIEQADAAGCVVDPMDRVLANVAEPPDTPAARP